MGVLEWEMEESRSALPRLVDIIHFSTEGTPDEQLYFSRFGFDQVVIRGDCPRVADRMPELTMLFNERYLYRRIAQETMPRWQVRLQTRMDSIVKRYERAYELYGLYAEELMEDVLPGEVETIKGVKSKLSGHDTVISESEDETDVKGHVADTPDIEINESDRYAGMVSAEGSKGKGKTTTGTDYGRTDDTDMTRKRTIMGGELLGGLNDSIDGWRDLDIRFIGEFEDMFLTVFD